QHRLAGAGPADDADDLAALHVEVDTVVHHLGAEHVAQAAHADRRRGVVDAVGGHGAGDGVHQSISRKNIAAKASMRITSEIVCTTLEVVRSPTDWAVPSVWKPSRQPISAIT